ncbi:NAD(P)-binding protein [Zalerion maritima]|uniref:NAD(P)-binding protein n=1 Tax=Zalerion maritima TaxID=339359 RepID=A0AAD5RP36_9PEZI|nr:NAD(P)-binding protein [Zalerion maritima]
MAKKSISFRPSRDIPSLAGRVILVTGGNSGLGKQCVLEYARHGGPSQIWLAARSLSRAGEAADEIKSQLAAPSRQADIRLLEMDLSSLASVRAAARVFLAEAARLDILMLNAGIMAVPPGLSKDGYEIQFATNHVGHALLAKLLLPALEKTASASQPGVDARARVVCLSSYGHVSAPKPEGIRFGSLRTEADDLGPYGRYGQSKLANVLWTRQMARLYPQFTFASIHPGVVRTNLMNNATGSSCAVRVLGKVATKLVTPVDQGARNQLWASVATEGIESGEYYEPVGIGGMATELGRDMDLAEKLWDWTEKELEPWIE